MRLIELSFFLTELSFLFILIKTNFAQLLLTKSLEKLKKIKKQYPL